jgi:hypothetical protein
LAVSKASIGPEDANTDNDCGEHEESAMGVGATLIADGVGRSDGPRPSSTRRGAKALLVYGSDIVLNGVLGSC